ncbi:hypothetical protein Tcan_12077 [Toxocara canis]|uniref:Uncharacterized protein n=1 Tax=Toxocara canis TaxID=6265 RepID=A0A0B2UPN1_TOXCA|nr:hypothetical protein Tcan_12077 [Toxocara canis]
MSCSLLSPFVVIGRILICLWSLLIRLWAFVWRKRRTRIVISRRRNDFEHQSSPFLPESEEQTDEQVADASRAHPTINSILAPVLATMCDPKLSASACSLDIFMHCITEQVQSTNSERRDVGSAQHRCLAHAAPHTQMRPAEHNYKPPSDVELH